MNPQDTEAKDIKGRKELEMVWNGQLIPKEPEPVIMGGKGLKRNTPVNTAVTQTKGIHKG